MVPKLRFNGFTIPWKKAQIGSILTIGSGRDYKHLAHGEVPVFGTGGLMTYVDAFLHDGETVCIGRKGTIDKPFYYSGKIWTVDTLFFTHSFINVLPKFVFNLFCNINWKEHNEASGVPSLSKSIIGKIEVLYPDLKEQTKIANFLASVDEKITLLNKQYNLLCQYKKAIMQKIFSQELRLKDDNGRNFPEWIKYSLGDVVTFFNGRAYKQTEWENNGTPVIRLQNLTGSGSEYYYSNLKLPDHQYCNHGDLLYMWSATMGPVWWKGSKAIFHYHIWKVISAPGKSTEDFIYYILDNITNKMLNEANGTTMAHITKAGIEKKIVNLPSIKEQIKIAKFLSTIDDEVSLKKAELDKLKTWKQGLLQQMFV